MSLDYYNSPLLLLESTNIQGRESPKGPLDGKNGKVKEGKKAKSICWVLTVFQVSRHWHNQALN